MTHDRSVVLEGKSVAYKIIRSGKARRLSLKLSPAAGLLLVVPKRLSIAHLDLDQLLQSKSLWILNKLRLIASLENRQPRFTPTQGGRLSFAGKEIALSIEPSPRKRDRVALIGNTLTVSTQRGENDHVRALVAKWYARAAAEIIPARVRELNRHVGYTVNSVSVRNQKSRWGSCSRKGNLNFNWRLLLVPPSVMDYLIYHELAHLKELNHSIRFWRLVEQLCPAFREAEAWLKREGRSMFW